MASRLQHIHSGRYVAHRDKVDLVYYRGRDGDIYPCACEECRSNRRVIGAGGRTGRRVR